MPYKKSRTALSLYVLSEAAGSWMFGTAYYILWTVIVKDAQSGLIASAWLVFPAFVMLSLSPLAARFAEISSAMTMSVSSFLLRSVGLCSISAVFRGLIYDLNPYQLVGIGFLIVVTSSIDSIFHAPVPFILANNYSVNLIMFRVTLMLVIRGANVLTPTFALLLIDDLQIALLLLSLGGGISLASSLMLTKIRRAPGQIVSEPRNDTIGGLKLVYFYGVLLFLLNVIFGHVTSIMLALHAIQEDLIAYQNAAFFGGFIVISITLIIRPKALSSWMSRLEDVIFGIAFCLSLLSVCFIFVLKVSTEADVIALLLVGLIYGMNLHLVTTILPSFLGVNSIYKDLNTGKISATCGSLIAGLWVGYVSVSTKMLTNSYTIIAVASFALAVGLLYFVIQAKRRMKMAAKL